MVILAWKSSGYEIISQEIIRLEKIYDKQQTDFVFAKSVLLF